MGSQPHTVTYWGILTGATFMVIYRGYANSDKSLWVVAGIVLTFMIVTAFFPTEDKVSQVRHELFQSKDHRLTRVSTRLL